jgi:hypothetical protein
VHGNRPDSKLLAGPDDAQGDFAAVGDQYLIKHGKLRLIVNGEP